MQIKYISCGYCILCWNHSLKLKARKKADEHFEERRRKVKGGQKSEDETEGSGKRMEYRSEGNRKGYKEADNGDRDRIQNGRRGGVKGGHKRVKLEGTRTVKCEDSCESCALFFFSPSISFLAPLFPPYFLFVGHAFRPVLSFSRLAFSLPRPCPHFYR